MAAAKSKRWIIGLTGKNASGKGVAAQALVNKGYHYHSLSDMLRLEAQKSGISHSREDLISLGQELRKQKGPGVLASKLLDFMPMEGMFVIDSIRHPEEIRLLKSTDTFLLIGIDAPPKIRFERAMKRGRNESVKTLEEFQLMENRENSSDVSGQQLDKCLSLADIILQNAGSMEELAKKVASTIEDRSFPVSEPSQKSQIPSQT
ncbi:MAG: AAA family ATPase [Bdellovibrionales bacterium]|nr:AAA family ATPase [Bdellovibrionales bacterium]